MDTQMLRTTVYLPDTLLNLAKLRAVEERLTVTQLVKEGLEGRLGVRKSLKKANTKVKFKFGGHDLGLKFKKFERWMAYE